MPATRPIASNKFGRMSVGAETVWGTAGATGFDVNPQAYRLSQFGQAIIANEGVVRTGFLPPAPWAGVFGEDDVELAFALVGLAARATAGTDAAPDGWLLRLMEACLGEGATMDTDGTYTAGSGVTGGGSTVASVTTSGGSPDQVTAIVVASGHGSRFNPGQMIVVFHGGVPYPMQVESISTDTLTVYGGPLASAGLAASDVIVGAATFALPVNQSAAAIDKSVSVEVVDSDAKVHRWTGCSGNFMIDAEAGASTPVMLKFALKSDKGVADTSAALSGGTAWPAASRRPAIGRSAFIRLGVVNGSGVYSVLGGADTSGLEAYSKLAFDAGIVRRVIDDVAGENGRSGRLITGIEPKLSLSGLQVLSRYALLGSPGAVQTGRALSVFFGDATYGGFGLFMRSAVLAEAPKHGDSDGIVTMDTVWKPQDDGATMMQMAVFLI